MTVLAAYLADLEQAARAVSATEDAYRREAALRLGVRLPAR
jgi:hypothetical protein